MEATTAATVSVPEWLLYFEAWLLSLLNRLPGTERISTGVSQTRFQTGLEIDHQALGFDNLREFITSRYSHLCTLETVGCARNRRLIVRPIKTRTRHISPAAEAYCVIFFAMAVGLCVVYIIDKIHQAE